MNSSDLSFHILNYFLSTETCVLIILITAMLRVEVRKREPRDFPVFFFFFYDYHVNLELTQSTKLNISPLNVVQCIIWRE